MGTSAPLSELFPEDMTSREKDRRSMNYACLVSIFSRGWITGRAALLMVAILGLLAAPSRSPAQRSQRHRQCGQSAGDTAAGHKPGSHTHLIPSYRWLPNVAGATSRQDETNATCGEIPSLGDPSGRQGARQAAQRQDSKHLQGMLNRHTPRVVKSPHLKPLARPLPTSGAR